MTASYRRTSSSCWRSRPTSTLPRKRKPGWSAIRSKARETDFSFGWSGATPSRTSPHGVVRRLALGHLERVAAAAGGDGVRVLDLEPGLLDRLEVVDLRAHQIRGAEGVDDDGDALALERVVALLGTAVEAEAVLESRAPAALDRDAQHRHVLLRRHQVADLHRRRWRQRDDALGALLDLHLRRIVAT